MVEEFLKTYAKLITTYPQKIRTERIDLDENFAEIIIYADKQDTGRLIGKDGKMINAIKTVIGACKSKDKISYRVSIKSIDE